MYWISVTTCAQSAVFYFLYINVRKILHSLLNDSLSDSLDV